MRIEEGVPAFTGVLVDMYLDTPVLVIDAQKMEQNILGMADVADSRGAVHSQAADRGGRGRHYGGKSLRGRGHGGRWSGRHLHRLPAGDGDKDKTRYRTREKGGAPDPGRRQPARSPQAVLPDEGRGYQPGGAPGGGLRSRTDGCNPRGGRGPGAGDLCPRKS